jgi:uncharacterized protein (TIGR00730 family)
MIKRVCIFCGSRKGRRLAYEEAAKRMGTVLAKRGIGVVYGGGSVGLMGVIADSVISEGGEIIGVIPKALVAREVVHTGLTDLHIVGSMHERKALMSRLSDAFIALPGGFGTLEEFCEVLTWAQLGLHKKPCGILNVEGFYDPLLLLFNRAVEEGFVSPEHRMLVLVETEPERLLELLETYTPPFIERYIERNDI